MSADGRWTSSCLSKQILCKKKLLQKTEVLCKFASKQEVLTNCCKIETLQIAEKNRGVAQIATKKTETLQPKKDCSKREALQICFKFVNTPTSV
jgi:hypothetical protein